MLGIDPGTTGMGYALLDLTTDPPRLLAHGLVETPRFGSAAEKLLSIADAIDALIATHGPAFLARAVQRMLVHLLELPEPVTQDNVADAIASALTHAQRVKFTAAVASAK